ncbi:MAG: hypothetical protein Q8K32_08150 [Archangium sp.]|nr:hypothetical protein [Archangium sp.]
MKTRWPLFLASLVLVVVFRELFVGAVQAGRDLSAHVFPETFFLVSQWTRGEIPLWLPNARLGQPFAALLYTQVFYAPRILTGVLFGHVLGPNVMHLFHAAWGFGGLWFASRRFGLTRAASFIAAAPFALSPFFTEFAQNLSFASGAAWAGWTLWAAEGLRRAPALRTSAWLAGVLGFAFHAGSPEMWFWQALLAMFVLARTRRSLGWGALSFVWAGALSAIVALPAFELTREWTKPGALASGATEWSLSWVQLLSIGIPGADLPRSGGYWGGDDQHFLFTLFIGSTALLLALLGVTVRRARPVLALTALCLVLALGKHFGFSELLLKVPPFRLFRYPVKYAVGGLFGLSVLAGFGARRLVALSRQGRPEAAVAMLGFAVGIALSARWSWAREGFRAGAPWLVLAAATIFIARRHPRLLAFAVAAELMFVPIERWDRLPASELMRASRLAPLLAGAGRLSIRVDLDDVEHEACGPWDSETDPLLEGRDRLAALRFVEEGLHAVGGYGFREPWRLKAAFAHGTGAFQVAGVNTFVRETWAPAPPWVSSVTPTPIEDVWIWKAPAALSRGFFVSGVRAGTDDEGFAALDSPAQLSREVVVDRATAVPSVPCDSPVTTTDVSAVHVEQQLTACAAGAVVLADAWYPGWIVEVDGQPAEALRAWGFVRAVQVSAGPHSIRWSFRPWSFRIGGALSLLALLALIAAAFHKTGAPSPREGER